MKTYSHCLQASSFVAVLILSSGVFAAPRSTLEIKANKETISAAEPLVVTLTYSCDEPQLSSDAKEPLSWLRYDSMLEVHFEGDPTLPTKMPLFPSVLQLIDAKGTKFACSYVLLYDPQNEEILFERPGKYSLRVVAATKQASNSLDITVHGASAEAKRSLASLTRRDVSFLLYGMQEVDPSTIVDQLQAVAELANEPIGQLAAARVGIWHLEKFCKKHRDLEQFRQNQDKDPAAGELLDKAKHYLDVGNMLPDAYPMRQEVLYGLSRVAFAKGDDVAAATFAKELRGKYPRSSADKRVQGWLDRLLPASQPSASDPTK